MKKFFQEFKEFALRGNVVDLSIGVLIGGAFSALVTAFTTDIINPIIGLLGTGESFGWTIPLFGGKTAILIGDFISSIINFTILAIVIFTIMKSLNALANIGKKQEEPVEEEPKVEEPSDEVKLLTEIRDLLAKNNEK